MPAATHGNAPLATVDVRELNTLMWGPLRAMFPSFAEEIELARYLKRVLAHSQCRAVHIEPHRDAAGQALDPHFRCLLRERAHPGGLMQLPERVSDLLRPDAFPHPARDIRLIETHISWVILAGEFAYKLRKPVNFGFLDFSTLEQRRADCRAEVVLNGRLCPDLYLDVVDVVQLDDGHLHIGGPGTPVEPAVKMHRLPESGMLPNLLDRGEGDERLMRRLAQQLAEFHAAAATGDGVDEYGSTDTLRTNWDENFAQTTLIDPSRRDAIRAYVTRFIADNTALFQRRIDHGRIREGHGDLHASSVCVTRRRLYLFDCIEFNARFRCADVAAEVAFLAMDLEHFGRADLASAFVEAYVRASHDSELRLLLDFYKCYRAFVRGKVLAFRLLEPHLDSDSTARALNDAQSYFDLAYALANPLPRPMLVVTMGLPGSGKTTLAHAAGEPSRSAAPIVGCHAQAAGWRADNIPHGGYV